VKQASSVEDVLARCEFVSVHVPLVDDTRNMISADRLRNVAKGLIILNFSRDGIVDDVAVCEAIKTGKVKSYFTDFPTQSLIKHEHVFALPHLGASTEEAEENCAVMVADQVRDFLEDGTIKNSVNFPEMFMSRSEGAYRLLVVNSNVPHMIERISSAIAKANLNILDMLNRSRGDIACTLVDVSNPIPQSVLDEIAAIEGVLTARSL